MAEMVWCESCKNVVWAYDHQKSMDIRGVLNHMKMPCGLCGQEGNFDGWGKELPLSDYQHMAKEGPKEIYDNWSLMKWIARKNGVAWNPDGQCRWFRPGSPIKVVDERKGL